MALRSIDLMIGDWVRGTATLDQDWYGWQLAPGECIQVRSILHTGINYESNGVSPSFEDDTIRFDDIEPIPLTPEILEKNGFKPDVPGDAYKYSYQIDSVSIVECYANAVGEGRHRGVISFGDTRLRITLVFVHELQHALLLCGIDKEIELLEL